MEQTSKLNELIKALRHCGKGGDIAERCLPCDYYDREPWCEAALVNDAAAALEAAEKRIAELMPEEGEWIDEQRGRWIYAKCNLCGKVQDVRSKYCPNCGAKMKGENDGKLNG